MEEWSLQANNDGYLNWEGFSLGLTRALQADTTRLRKVPEEDTPSTGAKRTLKSLQVSKGRGTGVSLLAKGVEAREIEEFLCQCEGRKLVQALALVRKEVYRCQMSLEQLTTERERAGEGCGLGCWYQLGLCNHKLKPLQSCINFCYLTLGSSAAPALTPETGVS